MSATAPPATIPPMRRAGKCELPGGTNARVEVAEGGAVIVDDVVEMVVELATLIVLVTPSEEVTEKTVVAVVAPEELVGSKVVNDAENADVPVDSDALEVSVAIPDVIVLVVKTVTTGFAVSEVMVLVCVTVTTGIEFDVGDKVSEGAISSATSSSRTVVLPVAGGELFKRQPAG